MYEGEYVETVADGSKVREGRGVQHTAAGQYDGEWANDAMHGRGKYTCTRDGKTEEYEGEFANNLFSGHGVYSFSSGARYEGEWRSNVMNGVSKYIDEWGIEWRGVFVDGRYDSLAPATPSIATDPVAVE